MKKKRYFIFAFLVVLSLSFVLAGFNVGTPEYSIENNYGPEFPIKGWINMSFSNEPLDSVFTDSFNNEITLEDALEANPSYNYDCVPSIDNECVKDYETLGSSHESIDFSVEPGRDYLTGISLNGNIESIDNISFLFSQGNQNDACVPQIKIDVLNNDDFDYVHSDSSSQLCSGDKSYGCFDGTGSTKNYNLVEESTYCQKINLSESPSYNVGSWISPISNTGDLEMSIYDESGLEKGSCSLSSISTEGEYSCDIDYYSEGGNHYVCVSNIASQGEYNIVGNSNPEDACGFFGVPVRSEVASYRIFAQGYQFSGGLQDLEINNIQSNGIVLSDSIQDYLIQRYGTNGGIIDCSGECIIPIKFSSDISQQATMEGLELRYTESGAGIVTETSFYDIISSPSEVTSNYQRIYLENFNFLTPDDIDTHDYVLSFQNEDIINEEIEVKDAPIIENIYPLKTASSIPTKFKIKLSSESNISSYEWDFGDGTNSFTTLSNSTTHTYNSTGVYSLNIRITDDKNLTSEKTFNINVTLPIDFINTKISNLESSIASIKSSTSVLNSFKQQGIQKILNLSFVESELERILGDFNDANNESEYAQIVNELLELDLPDEVVQTESSLGFVFIPQSEEINLETLQAIGGGEYTNEEAYKDAIIIWQQQSLNAKIDFQGFSQVRDNQTSHLVSFFDMNLDEKTAIDYPYYLIIPSLQNLEIQGISREEGSYSYKDISGLSNVQFYTSEDVDFLNLPVFISPSLNRLDANEEFLGEYREPSNTLWIVAALMILAIIAVFVYLVMKEWYKRKYESSLFKDRNDLYNMVNYVNNAKKKGLKESEIRKNLKDAGWSSERIRYVMRKYGGKNTGMFELPVDKIIKKVGKKEK